MIHQKRLTLSLLAVALSLLLAACRQTPEGAAQPPTDASTPPPPTATTEPAPTPTPTPLPIEAVHQGERDLRNGDWDSAIAAFEQVLADPGASDDERAMARIGLAHAALRSGDFAGAEEALNAFLAEHPEHPDAAQASFLRGEAKLGLNDWAGAIADFETYLSLRPGIIDSYVYERIADAQLAAGQQSDALASYDRALAAERSLVSRLQLREKVAQVNRSLGNTGGAVAQYQMILDEAQNPFYRATIEYYLGQTWFEAGETNAAYVQFERVFMNYPESYEALSSLRALLDTEREVDQYQRGVVNYNQGQYEIAIEAFLAHLASLESVRDDTPLTHMYIARAYRRLGNAQAALTELQALVNRFVPSDGEEWGQAWIEMADIHASLGAPESALATLDTFLQEHGDLPQAPDALYRAGQIAASTGDLTRAAGYFRELAASYPTDSRAAAGLFNAGLAAYRSGDMTTAEALFGEAAGMASNDTPAASLLWRGKVLLANGNSEEGAQVLNNAAATAPDDYYGLRAADLLAGREPFTPPENFTLPENPDEGREVAELWLVSTFGLEAQPPLATELRGDIAGDPRMVRAREMWDLGMIAEARQDFEAVRSSYSEDPLALYQLAIYFREIGLYRSSIGAVSRLYALAGVDPLDGPAFLARMRYPTYFSDLILRYAEQYNLDPLFVFAIIEQESLFEGFATSTASAQGLMQIWPPTGEDIAARLNWPEYHVSDLQRPVVNVAFGTWLLRDELNRFDDDKYAVLAAYNAGSGRAMDWQQKSGGDPDLFVEIIDLSEPRVYVQSIFEHYAMYRAIYGTSP